VDAALAAPSAGNLQSRFFYFVTDAKAIAGLKKAALGQACIDAPLVVVACADLASVSGYGKRGVELYSIQGVAASVENMMIAAVSLGLGTCWVGAFDEDSVGKSLGIPNHLRPEVIIPIGYSNESPEPGSQKPKGKSVRFV